MKLENNNIYCGNSYELIKNIPDHSIDMIYTDPPYSYDSGFGERLNQEGKITDSTKNHILEMSGGITREILDQMVRVMKYIYIYIYGVMIDKLSNI